MLGQRLGLVLVAGLALGSVACARGQNGGAGPKQPMGHVEVKHLESPDDAPDEAKTVEVAYIFDRDIVNKDFDKTFKDGFEKKGVKVDEELTAHAHFGVNQAKITGTVTYVKKSMGRFSIIEANLVAEAHYEADVQLDLDVKVKGDTKNANEKDWDGTAMGGKPFTLVKNVMPTNIPIAGPLFLHAHFDLTAACDLGVEGQMHATTGVGIKGDVRLAAKYKKAGFEKEDGKKSRFAFEAKTPNFELAPRPYVKVEGKQQSIKGKCSLQPTAVLLLEHSVGAKLMVEPWVELEASRPSSKAPWKLDAQAGVSVNAATDIELFGRQIRKPKEFTLFEVALTKKGDAMGAPTPRLPGSGPTPPLQTKGGRPAQEIARAGSSSAPAEDLRTADARPAPSPYAAEAPAPAAPAAPAVATAAAPAAPAAGPAAPAAATPTTTPAAAAADLARTSPVTLTRASVAPSTSATPTPPPDPRVVAAAAAPPTADSAASTTTASAPADKPKDPKDNTKDTSTKSNEVASAAPTPPTTPTEPDAAPSGPAQKPKRGKKSRKDSGSGSASTANAPSTASAPDSAPAPEPADKKKKPSLLDTGLGKPVAATAGRKPADIAGGVSKLVRKKRKD